MRVVLAFAIGFLTGALLIGAALWQRGGMPSEPEAARELPPPPPAPQVRPNRIGAPLDPPPAQAMQPLTAPAQGEAARVDLERRDLENRHEPAAVDDTAKLRAMALAMPVEGYDPAKLIDTWGESRGNGTRRHDAIDIVAPRGTPVVAAVEGNVVKLFESQAGGLTVYQFDNASEYCFYYAHLDRYASGLKEGMLLRKGDVLGYVGSSGSADDKTPHLHFSIFRLGPEKRWWEGAALNPYPVLR